MKNSLLLSVLSGIIAAATSAANAAVWHIDYNVDPETGWLTNGVVIEAINLGPSETSPFLYVEPVTVNGISFGTNAVLTTNWGGAYSSDVDSRYSGSDPALLNLYYTYRAVNSWTLGSSASFRFSNLTPGRVYQAQINSGAQWDWAALTLNATADSGSNTLYQYLGNSTSASVVYRSLYTWEATTNSMTGETNFAEVNMSPNGTTECRVFGYTLRDISYGPPAVYENVSISPGTNVYAVTPLTFNVRSAGALPLSYQWRKGGAHHQAMFIKKKLFDQIGFYNENGDITADWQFLMLVLFKFNRSFAYLDKIISVYDMDGISSKKENRNRISEEKKRFMKVNFRNYPLLILQIIIFFRKNYQRLRSIPSRIKRIISSKAIN